MREDEKKEIEEAGRFDYAHAISSREGSVKVSINLELVPAWSGYRSRWDRLLTVLREVEMYVHVLSGASLANRGRSGAPLRYLCHTCIGRTVDQTIKGIPSASVVLSRYGLVGVLIQIIIGLLIGRSGAPFVSFAPGQKNCLGYCG